MVVNIIALSLLVITILTNIILYHYLKKTKTNLDKKESERIKILDDLRSERTKRGMMIEQILPFKKDIGFNIDNFKFLGQPIDGIVFEEDKIIIVEFKSGKARPSKKQKEIKTQINQHKVEFKEVRCSG